jgi:hypothetical protein
VVPAGLAGRLPVAVQRLSHCVRAGSESDHANTHSTRDTTPAATYQPSEHVRHAAPAGRRGRALPTASVHAHSPIADSSSSSSSSRSSVSAQAYQDSALSAPPQPPPTRCGPAR